MQSFSTPMTFMAVDRALDTFDPADPHGRKDEFDDKHTAPLFNQPLYDTSKSTVIKASATSLEDFPDFSDDVMSDYKIQKMLGRNVEMPTIVDLDTSKDYVGFIKNTIDNVVASENEFDIRSRQKK